MAVDYSKALLYARLTAIAGTTEGDYGPAQTAALKVLGYELVQPIWGGVGERVTFGYVAKSSACTCGADRTGPSAEAHAADCPQANEGTVIAFRGTDPRKWLEDVEDGDAVLVRWDAGQMVHQGFKAVFDSLKFSVPDTALTLAGHSLGGALATLVARSYNADACYTFGSPRVGDTAFATVYDRNIPNTFRFVNRYDPIPTQPPESLGYQHVGQEIWLNGKFDWDNLIKQHELESYLKALEEMQ